MKSINMKSLLLAMAVTATVVITSNASAAIVITEVDPTGSSTSTYAADWFELTNTGGAAVDITGWKMDDNSHTFASAVALRGVTSIAAGQSAVFIEGNATGTTDATIDASFKTAWFGSNVPAGLAIGNYGGSGVGLSSTSDEVNIYNAGGVNQAQVIFNASTAGFTFNNAAGLNNTTISTLSVVGTNGAFLSANGAEIGSPAAVPEPESYAMMLAGLGLIGFMFRRKKSEE